MGGVILENLSGKKLSVLVTTLLLAQLTCFLIGGLIAPSPSGVQNILATKCIDDGSRELYFSRGKTSQTCDRVQSFFEHRIMKDKITPNHIVFTFQFPLPRDNMELDYSRWQQNLIGVLQPEIMYSDVFPVKPKAVLTMDIKLGYRNAEDPEDDWKLLASSLEERVLDCIPPIERKEDHIYNCNVLPLFEVGSLHHDYYLLNLRIPVNESTSMNDGIGKLSEVYLVTIFQNGGFTKVWLSLKAVFFPIIIGIMVWYWNRIRQLPRPPGLLEKTLFAVGLALTLLNFPVEFFSLWIEMPYLLLYSDIRQGIFYATLLSFWLIFAGEHMMVDDINRNRISAYWKHLVAVLFGCFCLFIFDMCERGVQLKNPFYSIWVTDVGTKLALAFIILAGISACVYFFFLSYMIFKVFRNISHKRMSLPSMSSARRLFYEGVIYRFRFLMLATLLCAALTVIFFIVGQVSEGRWKWDNEPTLEYTSAFFCGVYGMWNIYVFALIVLYSPSHKRWPMDSEPRNTSTEEIEFSRLPTEPTEISALTSITRKAATD